MSQPASLSRGVSPPPKRKASPLINGNAHTPFKDGVPKSDEASQPTLSYLLDAANCQPSLAAVEAGQAQLRDHLEYFARHLSEVVRPTPGPRLSIENFTALYKRNQHPHGHHFVIHQHDHPISGVHYDLRLQFSKSSTISFAVPYGLPGNPNSVRPNRMAVETRAHNLWNNLIESASHATGSLLIWDTGEYEVLDRPQKRQRMTDDEQSDTADDTVKTRQSQSEHLFPAFQSRHIHLRLNGARLPTGYTVDLRLPSNNDAGKQPRKPRIKRRRMDPSKAAELAKQRSAPASTDSESDATANDETDAGITPSAGTDAAIASEDEDEDEDEEIRANNAYPGASNTIGSIHQRHWFLTLDRKHSGFKKARSGPDEGRWVGPWEPFFVKGRDVERSIVTGRSADQVMEDEGVEKFVGRKMWRPIIE